VEEAGNPGRALAVLEVKASYSPQAAKAAIDHLAELFPLMAGVDAHDEPYKLYLPRTFTCGVVFAESAIRRRRVLKGWLLSTKRQDCGVSLVA
jgi:hypothetical protein